MNLWGLDCSVFDRLEKGFASFPERNRNSIQTAEYFLPNVISEMIRRGEASVQVLPSDEKWYGVTYREDKPLIVNAIP